MKEVISIKEMGVSRYSSIILGLLFLVIQGCAGIGPDLSQSPIMIMIPRFQHHNLERFHQIQVGDQIVV